MISKLRLVLVILILGLGQAYGQGARPWLGVMIDKHKDGILVKHTLPGSPARKAGVLAGDVITKVHQKAVSTPDELIKVVGTFRVGDQLGIELTRKGKMVQVKALLTRAPNRRGLQRSALVGQPAPDFSLEDLYGAGSADKHVRLQQTPGQVTVIKHWATWCSACRSALPWFQELAAKYKGKIRFMTISDEEASIQKNFLDKFPAIAGKPHYHVLRDPGGKVSAEYLVPALPNYFLVDQNGRMIDVLVGGQGIKRLVENKALPLLKDSP